MPELVQGLICMGPNRVEKSMVEHDPLGNGNAQTQLRDETLLPLAVIAAS